MEGGLARARRFGFAVVSTWIAGPKAASAPSVRRGSLEFGALIEGRWHS